MQKILRLLFFSAIFGALYWVLEGHHAEFEECTATCSMEYISPLGTVIISGVMGTIATGLLYIIFVTAHIADKKIQKWRLDAKKFLSSRQ